MTLVAKGLISVIKQILMERNTTSAVKIHFATRAGLADFQTTLKKKKGCSNRIYIIAQILYHLKNVTCVGLPLSAMRLTICNLLNTSEQGTAL